MKILIAAAAGVAVGVVLGLIWGARSRRGKRSRGREWITPETMKQIVWVCLGNGIAWVWCSYILAYLDKVQIAESLSQVAVTEIIAVVVAYAIKSGAENMSKNNRWPDKGGGAEGE